MSNKYILNISRWLDKSPVSKVLVAFFSVLAFIFSFVIGVWEVVKENRTVEIVIAGQTSYSLYASVSMEQLLGRFPSDVTGQSPKIPTPYFPISLIISNPTAHDSTILGCELYVGFYKRDGKFGSISYMSRETLSKGSYDSKPYIHIHSGEVVRAPLLFFFIPKPELASMLKDKTTQANKFSVHCKNETWKRIDAINNDM